MHEINAAIRRFIEESQMRLRTTTEYAHLDEKGRQAYRDGYVRGFLDALFQANIQQKKAKRLSLADLERRAGNAGDKWRELQDDLASQPNPEPSTFEQIFLGLSEEEQRVIVEQAAQLITPAELPEALIQTA
jgi:hypothetical protein